MCNKTVETRELSMLCSLWWESEVTEAFRIPSENSYILHCTLCSASKLTLLTMLRPSWGHLFKTRTSKSHARAPGGSCGPARVGCRALPLTVIASRGLPAVHHLLPALLSNSRTRQLSVRPILSYLSSAIVFHRKHVSCFLGFFLYSYMTAEPSLSGCTPQLCSLSLREEDSTAGQLGHAGSDGPGSWAEIRKSTPHSEFEISSAPEVLVPSWRLWKRTAKYKKKNHRSHASACTTVFNAVLQSWLYCVSDGGWPCLTREAGPDHPLCSLPPWPILCDSVFQDFSFSNVARFLLST